MLMDHRGSIFPKDTWEEQTLRLKFGNGYGAKRIRTADPFNAIEVLYQLSYSPVQRRQ